MGIEKFSIFISKFVNNIDNIQINNNNKKFYTDHIMFDINFLLYQGCFDIENKINDLHKIILCKIEYTNETTINYLNNIIRNILSKKYWKLLINIDSIIELKNIDDLNNIIDINETIINRIIYLINKSIDNIHYVKFIKSIVFFFDGIPSLSKILEQKRRRIKNFLENEERKKLFAIYINTLSNIKINLYNSLYNKRYFYNLNYINDIDFEYKKWFNNKCYIDKSIYPLSDIVLKLETYLETIYTKERNSINIVLNKSNMNGESDIKIFKYILDYNINGNVSIHTTDSDLIHHIIVQKIYYLITDNNVSLTMFRYVNNYNDGNIQIFNANNIINSIFDINTKLFNSCASNNYKLIWDLSFIFYFFGNDHLSYLLEIKSDLGINYFIQSHYNSLKDSNIINLKNNKIDIDLDNLLLYLIEIYKQNNYNVTKIILHKFFKINIQLINLFIDDFNYTFEDILIFLKKFIIYKASFLSQNEINELYEDDMRKIFTQNITNIKEYNDVKLFKFNNIKLNLFLKNIGLIESNINYYHKEFNGLILYIKQLNINYDSYLDLNTFISEKAKDTVNNKYPQLCDNINIDEYLDLLLNTNKKINNELYYSYLKKIYHLTITCFGDMRDYHFDNVTYFKYCKNIKIDELIIYLKSIKNKSALIEKWNQEISNENINDNYINSKLHYEIITPYKINKNFIKSINSKYNYKECGKFTIF